MGIEDWTEADVREEIAAPLLTALGYKKGTAHDVLREEQLALSYPKIFLGRKKPGKDPVIRGRPDYVLSVLGVGRWILEVKSPNEAIDTDAIEQAISYARHPEVTAYYVALLNGKEFFLYNFHNTASDQPLMPPIRDEGGLHAGLIAEQVGNVLSPDAIRRDIQFPSIDHGRPLGSQLRSREDIRGGLIRYSHARGELLSCPDLVRPELERSLVETEEMAQGLQNAITSGEIGRDGNGRIVARLQWSAPHQILAQYAEEKGLFEVDYVSLSDALSSDESHPTTFDVVGQMDILPGETVFDLRRWRASESPIPIEMTYRGQAVGILQRRSFFGDFQAEYFAEANMMGAAISYVFQLAGSFEVRM